jgi:MbtH protein
MRAAVMVAGKQVFQPEPGYSGAAASAALRSRE